VLRLYPKDVMLVFKNFPLTRMHRFAMDAARAAMAAYEQGKFWQYHDLLFAADSKLNEEKFVEIAGNIGLDMEKFNDFRKSDESLQRVTEDLQEAVNSGVRGTPTLYVNGRMVEDRSLDNIQKLIEGELAKKK